MSTTEIPGTRIHRNTDLLEQMPRLAYQQLREAQHGRANTRKQIIRAHQQAAQQGRLNAALPPEAWEAMDDAVYRAGEDTLTIVQDLRAMGLTYSVSLDYKYDTWGIIEDQGGARVGMTPEAESPESSISAEEDGSPIPVIDDGFSIGFREAPADEDRLPDAYDTTQTTVSSRHVSERVEEMFIDAEPLQVTGTGGEGYSLYGMTDHPDTATGSTSADWTNDNTVVRDDLRAMRSVLKNDRNFRPGQTGFWVYMGTEYYDVLDDADPEGDGNQTIRDRVENLANIADGYPKEADFLPEKSVLMFRPTEDVIQVGMGTNGLQTVQWEDPFRDHYRVMGSMYPRIKRVLAPETLNTDYVNGIVYWTA